MAPIQILSNFWENCGNLSYEPVITTKSGCQMFLPFNHGTEFVQKGGLTFVRNLLRYCVIYCDTVELVFLAICYVNIQFHNLTSSLQNFSFPVILY